MILLYFCKPVTACYKNPPKESPKAVNWATVVDNGSCYRAVVRWPCLTFHERKNMFSTLIVMAVLAIPFLLELYFNVPRDSETADEEYIPDGR